MKLDFKTHYLKKVVPELNALEGYTNPEQVPKILKVCVNRGIGEAAKNSKALESTVHELALITGQRPQVTKAKKSVAGFKIRDGMTVGAFVTLRKKRMYAFLEKFVHIVLPRIRDFRGVSVSGFAGQGNYNLGIRDRLVFPEVLYGNSAGMQGFNISIVTSANSDREGYALLRSFGMPFADTLIKDT